MRTALDSSVILDVLTNDKKWADASQKSLIESISLGSLVIGEGVLAEITPALDSGDLSTFLKEWGIQFLPTSQAAAVLAGEMYRTYLKRKGNIKRVLCRRRFKTRFFAGAKLDRFQREMAENRRPC
jgi:hypothetical protein